MKLINKIYILAGVLFFNSCSDFMDKQPTDQISEGTFYKNKAEIDNILTACYATLQDHMYTHSIAFVDCLADNGYNHDNYWNSRDLSVGPITPTTSGVDFVYKMAYKRIARYNIFLKKLAEYRESDLAEDIKIDYEAEVRLMRSIAYLELYKFYGAVPLVLEPLTYETQDQPKAEDEAIFSQVIADADFAIENLPAVSYAKNGGHFVKSSAQVLKARALLFKGYDENGIATKETLTEAKLVLADIINTGFYSIGSSYRGLFCDDLGEQEGNPEYVFSVKYMGPNNNASSYWNYNRFIVYLTWGTGGECNPFQSFVDEYGFIDGTPFSTDNPLYDPNDILKNRDPRLAKTVFSGTCTFENGYQFTTSPSATGFTYYKLVTGSEAENPTSGNYGSDWPSMRYAEVLLMYAEAMNEVDGPTQAVYDAINQIRDREDIRMPHLTQGMSQEEMRQAIRKERRIELAFEGFRYDDLKRWRLAEEKLNMTVEEAVIPRNFEKRNYHWPIPQAEIDKSNGILVQNPDYI